MTLGYLAKSQEFLLIRHHRFVKFKAEMGM
jgi:hypothetical protein